MDWPCSLESVLLAVSPAPSSLTCIWSLCFCWWSTSVDAGAPQPPLEPQRQVPTGAPLFLWVGCSYISTFLSFRPRTQWRSSAPQWLEHRLRSQGVQPRASISTSSPVNRAVKISSWKALHAEPGTWKAVHEFFPLLLSSVWSFTFLKSLPSYLQHSHHSTPGLVESTWTASQLDYVRCEWWLHGLVPAKGVQPHILQGFQPRCAIPAVPDSVLANTPSALNKYGATF